MMNDANKTQATLKACCTRVYHEMDDLGLSPGKEDWVRHPDSQRELEHLIRDVWIEHGGGTPSEWPWNQSWVLLSFIRVRKQNRSSKNKDKLSIPMGGLFDGVDVGNIYFIRNSRGHVKVGWTSGDPAVRMKALQTGESEPLKLMGWIVGSESQERAIHVQFAAYRTAGGGTEWFFMRDELKEFIDEALKKAGGNDE
jgi:hypothetical protein